MNKTYKVIYNRTRCMYQVVSELAKGRTKSETPEMLKNVFSKHGSLARGIVMAVLSMSLAMPVGVAVQADDTPVVQVKRRRILAVQLQRILLLMSIQPLPALFLIVL